VRDKVEEAVPHRPRGRPSLGRCTRKCGAGAEERSDEGRELASEAAVVVGRKLTDGFDESCDVVIVGSGAGGSVMARFLAEAGQRVVVLEEGPYYTPKEYGAFRPTESLRRIWRESGLLTAFGLGQTPIIGLSAGRCVGDRRDRARSPNAQWMSMGPKATPP